MKNFVLLATASFLLWLLLTASLDPQEVMAGIIVSLLAAGFSHERVQVFASIRLTPDALLAFVRYLATFIVALFKANIDMARRVLSPSLPLNPAVVEVSTALSSELGKLILANSITLTPGTLAVDIDGDRLLVHWVDCPPGSDIESATAGIAADFEKHIAGFVE
jgi:multicomponent Na+:H+ antiporter subunit E